MSLHAEADLTIARPPAEVFAVVADVAHHPEWAGAVREVRALDWKEGGVGSTFEQVTSAFGRTVASRVTVTEFVPEARFAAEAKGMVPGYMVWDFSPTASGTKVHMSLQVDPGPLGGFVISMMRPRIHREMVEDLKRLKARVESAR